MTVNWYKLAMALPDANYGNLDLEKEKSLFGDSPIRAVDRWLPEEKAKELHKEHGPLNYVAHGGYGVAYETPSGAILKVTTDLIEMDAANKVLQMQKEQGKFLKHVVGVYSVDDNGKTASILLEKARHLTKQEDMAFVNLYVYVVEVFHVGGKIHITDKEAKRKHYISREKVLFDQKVLDAVNELLAWEHYGLIEFGELLNNVGWVIRDGKEVLAVLDLGAIKL